MEVPYCDEKLVMAALTDSDDPTGDLATAAGSPGIPDAIAEASSRVDVYLSGRYQVPVGDAGDGLAPAPIRFWARNIAAYLATLSQKRNEPVADTEPVVVRYRATMDELKAVQAGTLVLNLPTPVSGDADSSFVVVVNPIPCLFEDDDFYGRGTARTPGGRTRYGW